MEAVGKKYIRFLPFLSIVFPFCIIISLELLLILFTCLLSFSLSVCMYVCVNVRVQCSHGDCTIINSVVDITFLGDRWTLDAGRKACGGDGQVPL